MRNGAAGYAYLAVTVLVWGTAYPIIDLAERYISPVMLALLRAIIGGAVLAAVARRLRGSRRLFVSGLINIGIFLVLLNLSVELSPNPSLAAVMMYTQPLFVALLSPYALGKRISPRQYAGVAVGDAGIAAVVMLAGGGLNAGILLGLLGGLVWALGTLYFERYVSPYESDLVSATAFMSLASAPVIAVMLPLGTRFVVTASSLLLAVYISAVIQAVGWLTWFYGVRALGGVKAGAFSLLTPVIAIVSTSLMLHELLPIKLVVASAAVVLGALLVQLG